MDINDVMEINKENKLFIEEMLASYNHNIKKYIIFDNSTVKINIFQRRTKFFKRNLYICSKITKNTIDYEENSRSRFRHDQYRMGSC